MLPHKIEILLDLKAKQKPAPAPESQRAALGAGDVPSFGLANAKVTVVLFADFECPYSLRTARLLPELRRLYEQRVRFVFRHRPLPFHDHARGAAAAAIAAHRQGKFWEYAALLFDHQSALERKDLESYARGLGLNANAFSVALDDPVTHGVIEKDLSLGDAVDARGTPVLLVNGIHVDNPTDPEMVTSKIEEALSQK
jgi:protein-disulfide isomerase